MKTQILGFSTGAYGRLDGPLFLLASGEDIELREGDIIDVVIIERKKAKKHPANKCRECGAFYLTKTAKRCSNCGVNRKAILG